MLLRGQFHTTYCTNVHPGANWETTFRALETHLDTIRASVDPAGPFGLGLRLSDQASRELGLGDRFEEFRDWLEAHHTYVFTMNGFPFGNFHGQRVKDQVHQPDWTTEPRLEYTLRLFRQLENLLPPGLEGGISTSPVSYRHWHPEGSARDAVLRKGARAMAEIALELAGIEARSGKYLHLDIEPEPDGLLENSADVIRYFGEFLIPQGVPLLSDRLGVDPATARTLLLRHLTLCYDICHFALAFETPAEVFPRLEAAGIRTGKIQVSAALRIRPQNGDREGVLQALRAFDEPVYLHQVTARGPQGVHTWPDLPDLLKDPGPFEELRAHFHVPIFTERYGLLEATQREILEVLDYVKQHPVCSHLEVETYTWEVLPPGLKEALPASISRELSWLQRHLES